MKGRALPLIHNDHASVTVGQDDQLANAPKRSLSRAGRRYDPGQGSGAATQ